MIILIFTSNDRSKSKGINSNSGSINYQRKKEQQQ